MGDFEDVRNRVDILDVAARLGIRLNRPGKALCPIHSEKTPSLSFRGQRWRCFGCNAGGDVIDLTSAVLGVSALDAARQLDSMYGLRLFEAQPDTAEIYRRSQQAQAAREQSEAVNARVQRAGNTIAEYLRTLERWRLDYAPRAFGEKLNPLYIEAVKEMDFWDYIFTGVFVGGSFETKALFCQTHAEQLAELVKRMGGARDGRKTDQTVLVAQATRGLF